MKITALGGREVDIKFVYDEDKIVTTAYVRWQENGRLREEDGIAILGERDQRENRYSKYIGRKVALARAMKNAGFNHEFRKSIWDGLIQRGFSLTGK